MNGCADWRDRLAAVFDGELDALHAAEVEAHAAGCAACTAALEEMDEVRMALRAPGARETAPARLTARLEGALRAAQAPPIRARTAWRERTNWGLGGGGLAVAACVAAAFLVLPAMQVRTLEQDLVASHVRSQLAGHLIDVATSNEHVVKPWFGGKLDYSPPVVDLADHGFPIVGGRLDYIGHRDVAAIVYSRGAHVINLFVWPDAKAPGPAEAKLGDGYALLHWSKGGMTFWAVSDVNETDLRTFAGLLKAGA